MKSPLLLSSKNDVKPALLKDLKRLGVKNVILLGGENSLSTDLENKLKENYKTERLAGKNRYETSAEIAKG